MNMHDLERHGQPLLQQEANLTYQIGQAEDRLAELTEQLAKVQGKLELLREMAEELTLPASGQADDSRLATARTEHRHNGVRVEAPQEEEEA